MRCSGLAGSSWLFHATWRPTGVPDANAQRRGVARRRDRALETRPVHCRLAALDGDVCASSTPIPAGNAFVHMRVVATYEPATAGRQQSSHQHRFLQIARYPEGGTLALVGRCGMARGASRRSTQRDRGAHSPTNRWGSVTMSPRKQRAPYSGPSTALGRTVGVRLGGCSAGSQPVGCTMNQSKIAAQMLHGCCAKTCDLRICRRDRMVAVDGEGRSRAR